MHVFWVAFIVGSKIYFLNICVTGSIMWLGGACNEKAGNISDIIT